MTLEEYRENARTICDEATNGEVGVRLRDPIYRKITEGRDMGPGYSSCGDLAHYLLFRLGVRADWINRSELHGGFAWGMNVNRLARKPIGRGAGGLARLPAKDEIFQTGDILIIWREGGNTTDAHVLVVDSFDGVELHSWDYGQGPMRAEVYSSDVIEGRKRTRKVVARVASSGKCVLEGGRAIQSVIPLADVAKLLEAVA